MSPSSWGAVEGALLDLLTTSRQIPAARVDAEGRLVEGNPALARLLGLDAIPVGEPLEDHLDPPSRVTLARALHREPASEIGLVLRRAEQTLRLQVRVAHLDDGTALLLAERALATTQDVLHQLSRLNDELANATRQLTRQKIELERALSRVKRLEGLIPICMHCHRIRDDTEAWQRLEAYLGDHTDAMFSHSLCPECLDKYYPDEE